MESHDETGARRASERAEEGAGHTHPAGPSQPDSGFAEGIEHKPDGPEREPDPDFARGERTVPEDEETQGNFAQGAEQLPNKHVERRFSEGIERKPRSE